MTAAERLCSAAVFLFAELCDPVSVARVPRVFVFNRLYTRFGVSIVVSEVVRFREETQPTSGLLQIQLLLIAIHAKNRYPQHGGCDVILARKRLKVSLEKADAIVIRQVDFSESSRVVTFFSREFGKFATLAKGAKRLKGPFDAALDLLSACRIVFIRKTSGTLNLLTEARLISRFQPQNPGAKGGLSSLYGGYYVAELLSGLTEDFDPAPEVYDLAISTLSALSSSENQSSPVIIHFEISLLQRIGLLPNLFECSVCGEAVEKGHQFAHWVSQGGLLCGACRREEFAGVSITSGSVEILRRLTQEPPDNLCSIEFTKKQSEECHRLAVSAITHALGRRPSTLRYIQI